MNINLHIERLILDGVAPERGQEPLLQAAIATELARLLSAGGLAPDLISGGATPRLSAGEIRLPAEKSAHQLGQQIARAVYGGIGK
ncbi:MAG: hypothetical protein WCF57_01930 [Pyrinomonadaceae bacterium]